MDMTQIQNANQSHLTGKEIDIGQLDLRPSASKQASKPASKASSLTIVNTKRNGRRITIAREVIVKIGSPTLVQIALNKTGVAIGKDLTGDDNNFQLRNAAKNAVIYSSELVQEITDTFDLDFTGRTSLSYHEVTYLNIKGKPVAFIAIKQKDLQDHAEEIGSESLAQEVETDESQEPEELEESNAVDVDLDVDPLEDFYDNLDSF
jgi:hypothetical protein